MAVGLSESSTVTVAVAVSVLPLTSVTVRITTFEPILEQSNSVMFVSKELIPQASVDPSLIASSEIVTLPAASKYTVIFCVCTSGSKLSTKFREIALLAVRELSSVTVTV